MSSNGSSDSSGSPGPADGALSVAVRIRTLNSDEKAKRATQVAYKIDQKMIMLMDPGENLDDVLRQHRTREKQYVYDTAFGPDSNQEEVYEHTTKPLIDGVLDGYNATVFAYGATGAGKTYTMLGTDNNPGIMARALQTLFDAVGKKATSTYDVSMSYLEIYNELIRDLLHPSSAYLDLREDTKGNVHVTGLSEVKAKSSTEVLSLLMQGNQRRTQEPTAMNKTSSRSHAVLQVQVQSRNKYPAVKGQQQFGKLFLIDLAGSERASQTQNTGLRMKEGAHINRSLLALGNVINTLSEKGAKYVNYRDSKLTRLLKDSLGGNSRTVMIANISPASTLFEETRNTLIYAERAKSIRNQIKKNTKDVTYHATQYQSIVAELRKEITRLKTRLDQRIDEMEKNSGAHRATTSHSYLPESSSFSLKSNVSNVNYDSQQQQSSMDFLKSHEKLLSLYEQRVLLRRRLMDINDQAHELALSLSDKQAVMEAFDNKRSLRRVRSEGSMHRPGTKETSRSEELPPYTSEADKIRSIRDEIGKQEKKIDLILQRRSDLETDLSNNKKKIEEIELTIPKKMKTNEHKTILSLTQQLHDLDTDRVILESDQRLLERNLNRHENSLKSMEKYTDVVDRLIRHQHALLKDNNITTDKVQDLFQTYERSKSSVYLHLIPIDNRANDLSCKSWNRKGVEDERKERIGKIFSKTMNVADLKSMKAESDIPHPTRLPPIESSSSSRHMSFDDTMISKRRRQLEAVNKNRKRAKTPTQIPKLKGIGEPDKSESQRTRRRKDKREKRSKSRKETRDTKDQQRPEKTDRSEKDKNRLQNTRSISRASRSRTRTDRSELRSRRARSDNLQSTRSDSRLTTKTNKSRTSRSSRRAASHREAPSESFRQGGAGSRGRSPRAGTRNSTLPPLTDRDLRRSRRESVQSVMTR